MNAKFPEWNEYKLFFSDGKKIIYKGPYLLLCRVLLYEKCSVWQPCNVLHKCFIEAIILLKLKQFQFSPPWWESFICKRGDSIPNISKRKQDPLVINPEPVKSYLNECGHPKTTKIATKITWLFWRPHHTSRRSLNHVFSWKNLVPRIWLSNFNIWVCNNCAYWKGGIRKESVDFFYTSWTQIDWKRAILRSNSVLFLKKVHFTEYSLYTHVLCRCFIDLYLTLTLTKRLLLKILTHTYTNFRQWIL